jgi:hypothetical protein
MPNPIKELKEFTTKVINEMLEKTHSGFLSYHFDQSAVKAEIASMGIQPSFSEVVFHHITLVFPFDPTKASYVDGFLYSFSQTLEEWLSQPKTAKIIGHAKGEDIEAFVVEIDGQSVRPKFEVIDSKGKTKAYNTNGERFHITFSKEPSVPAKKSNDIISKGFDLIDGPTFKVIGKV